jgi:high frequency lysogenization protein
VQTKFDNIVIALAGIVQAVYSIEEIAQTGKTNEIILETSVNSLFQTNPANALAVFGSVNHLQHGLEKLIIILNTKSSGGYLIIKHIFSLMSIQKKISRSPIAMHLLTERLNQAKKQVDYFDVKHPTVIANLADIYLTVIGPFRFRYYISGNQQVFSVKENMEKIRALLLSAIRASVLWRQMGGSRLQLIFAREKIKSSARLLLNHLTQ